MDKIFIQTIESHLEQVAKEDSVFAQKYSQRKLQDIMDFFKEGEALRHCVYKSEYYKRDDVLVIGARVKNKRMETIELDIKSGTILQCRGKCNQNSPHHQKIYNLMQNNIQKFTRALQA